MKLAQYFTLKNKVILSLLVLIGLILLIYWPVQHYGFLNYDDQGYVTLNSLVQSGFTFHNISEVFSSIQLGNWHPLTMLSHMADWALFGKNAGGHHWTSVILHIANAVLLFILFYMMTGSLWHSVFIAALFAVHPINVESVAWIAERKNVLSTFFWILTMVLYVRYVKSPNWKCYLAVLISFTLGLMSKPMLVTLPFVLLLLDYWPLGRLKIKQHNGFQPTITTGLMLKESKILFLILEKVPLIILSLIASYVTIFAQKNAGAMLSLNSFPLLYRLDNAIISYGLYVKKMFWPFDLAAFYPFNYNMSLLQIILFAVLLILVTIFACRYFRKFPYLIVGWMWFLGTMLPVIGIIQVGHQAMADRYAYVPLIGLFVMLVWGSFDFLKRYLSSKIILLIALLIILSLSITAHRQVRYWQDTLTLFSQALAVTENNEFAHSNVAGELLLQNRIDEAMIHCEKALLLDPNNYNTLVRIARAYSVRGQNEKAIDSLRKAIHIHPGDVKAYDDLYFLLMQVGKPKEALDEYRKAVENHKYNADIYYHYGTALARQGYYKEALLQFQQALRLRPYDADVYGNIGMVLIFSGNNDEAIKYFKEAVKINPNHAHVHYRLAVILKQKGMVAEADYHIQQAIRINPEYKNNKY